MNSRVFYLVAGVERFNMAMEKGTRNVLAWVDSKHNLKGTFLGIRID